MEIRVFRIVDWGLRIGFLSQRLFNPKSAIRNPQWIAALVTLLVGAPALAQTSEGAASKPWFVSASHYGKWVTLASTGGLLAEGALRHRTADREYASLVSLCRDTPLLCDKAPNGSYLNAQTETLYQRTVSLDHGARNWIVAGEASLLAAGTMFLLDLVYHHDGPKNIPYAPFAVYVRPGKLGMALRF